MNYSRTIAGICMLFILAAAFVSIGSRVRALAIPIILIAVALPLVAHCRAYGAIVRIASGRYPERWQRIRSDIGIRHFVFDRDDLSDPDIAASKRSLRRWGMIFAASSIGAMTFTATCASILH